MSVGNLPAGETETDGEYLEHQLDCGSQEDGDSPPFRPISELAFRVAPLDELCGDSSFSGVGPEKSNHVLLLRLLQHLNLVPTYAHV